MPKKERICAHCGKPPRTVFDGVANVQDKYCTECYLIYTETMRVFDRAQKEWIESFNLYWSEHQ